MNIIFFTIQQIPSLKIISPYFFLAKYICFYSEICNVFILWKQSSYVTLPCLVFWGYCVVTTPVKP